MIQDLPVAALGGQPRLHRPQPVVRALRRRGPARLPALRPRSREGPTPVPFERVRETALHRARRPRRRWACRPTPRPPARAASTSTCRSCAARPRRTSGTFAKRFAAGAGRAAARSCITAEYRIAKRPQGRVLVDYNQNAWGRTLASDLLGAAASAGGGVDARHLGRGRGRHRDRGVHAAQRARARPRARATCGRRSCRRRDGSGSRSTCRRISR